MHLPAASLWVYVGRKMLSHAGLNEGGRAAREMSVASAAVMVWREMVAIVFGVWVVLW